MSRKSAPPDYVGPTEKSIRLEVSHNTLLTYRRRLFRSDLLQSETPLDEVRHIHWYTSLFSRVGTIRVTLWDRPTTFETLFDTTPTNKEARELGTFRAPDLLANPTAYLEFVAFFSPLLTANAVTSAVDLRTLKPTEPSGTPTPGIFRTSKRITYDPHLAETERQMRAERDI